jgi:hypothetical protein
VDPFRERTRPLGGGLLAAAPDRDVDLGVEVGADQVTRS